VKVTDREPPRSDQKVTKIEKCKKQGLAKCLNISKLQDLFRARGGGKTVCVLDYNTKSPAATAAQDIEKQAIMPGQLSQRARKRGAFLVQLFGNPKIRKPLPSISEGVFSLE